MSAMASKFIWQNIFCMCDPVLFRSMVHVLKYIVFPRYLGISSSFGSNAVNVEQWRCVHILRGHTGDVLDLCWSPDDSMLASSSVDNNIYIWNAKKFPGINTKTQTLLRDVCMLI